MQTSQVGTPHARIFNEATKHHFARISDESTRSVDPSIVEPMFDIEEMAAVDPHANEAALIEQVAWLEGEIGCSRGSGAGGRGIG